MNKNFIITILCFGILFVSGGDAAAATRTVDNVSDNAALSACTAAAGDCSLRGAIGGAAAGDTIDFDGGVFAVPQTITLGGTSNPIIIAKNLTVNGPGADVLTVSGNNASLVFDVRNFTVALSGMTVTGGNGRYFLNNSTAPGGAIYNQGNLTVTACLITGNQSAPTFSYTGGIYNGNVLTLIGSTVAGNTARFNAANSGGGISSQVGTLNIINSTISGNTVSSASSDSGGGVLIFSGGGNIVNSTITANSVNTANRSAGGVLANAAITVRNSIVADNANNAIIPDVAGSFVSRGSNLVGNRGAVAAFSAAGDQTGTAAAVRGARLTPLGNYGGRTPTHALLQNSPALDAGDGCVLDLSCAANNPPAGLQFDQRGVAAAPRLAGAAIDIGAFEQNIRLVPAVLPNRLVSSPYNETLSAVRLGSLPPSSEPFSGKDDEPRAFPPFTFTVVPIPGESLPPGLVLSGGAVTGTTSSTPGTYTFTVRAEDVDGLAGFQQYTIAIVAPTAAAVSVAGRITTPNGAGLRNARVVLTDSEGNSRAVLSTSFGYFRFADVEAGRLYTISVVSKRCRFTPLVVSVSDNVSDLHLIAEHE